MQCEMVYDKGQCQDEAKVAVQDEELGERHLCTVCAIALNYVEEPRWIQQLADDRMRQAKKMAKEREAYGTE